MQKVLVPETIQTFRFKKNESEERMANAFVAYVRVVRRANVAGYIVFSSNHEMGSFVHDNFASYWVGADQRETKQIETLVDGIRQENRTRYLDENFVASMAINGVSAYAKMILEDVESPQAMSFGMITIDGDGHLSASMGTGATSSNNVVTSSNPSITLAGCTASGKRKAVNDALVRRLIKGPGTAAEQKALSKEIQGITGLAMAGCAAIPQSS